MKSLKVLPVTALIGFFIQYNISTSYAGDFQTDSLALIALYDSTNGDNWDNNTGWKTGPVFSWYGIELEGTRVVEILLPDNNLTGSIPPAIGDADSLERLVFNGNTGLTGSIPPEIGSLTRLKDLYIYNCNLTGSIPPEMGNMESIGEIFLNMNALSDTIPATLGNLSKLAFLDLNSNQLTGSIPPELSNLSDLYTLSLAYNQLSGGIPAVLENLTKLNTLMLSGNPLGGTIPPELGNIPGLQHIYMHDCQLTGPIPVEITSLAGLRTLILSGNELTGNLPVQLSDLTDLVTLNLYANLLSGEIPPELGNLSSLQQLSLSSNNFTGSIPPELGNLSNLRYFELYGNELTGTIPPELGNLTKLWNFLISENNLTGNIPPELGNLTSLKLFFIQNNELSGPVPEELTAITSLSNIHIRNNKLEDLPDFSVLSSVEQFHVENNRFTFGDLEPNIHILDTYVPQDSIGTNDTVYFAIEDTLQLFPGTDGLYNNYQWTYNGGDISDNNLYSGTNDSILRIMNPESADAGLYSCRVTNDTVTGLTLFRHPILLAPSVKVTGLPETLICAGDLITIGYKSVKVSPVNEFTAELSDFLGSFDDAIIIGNVVSTDSIGTIEANIPGNISAGNQYRIRINSSSPAIVGIPSAGTLNIMNGDLSAPEVTPSGDAGFCDGENLVLNTDSIADLMYIWYKDDAEIDDATSYLYTANEEGIYYVKIFNACSSDSLSSNTVNISIDPLPTVNLSVEGPLLTATQNPNYGYVWYKDGDNLLIDDTEYQYTAIENGEYWVVVTDNNGCTETSNSQTVSSITGIDYILPGMDIFPNPTNNKVNIILKSDIKIERISITDVTGNTIYSEEYNLQEAGESIVLDVSKQNPGIYMVFIKTSEGSVYFKLVRQ